MGATPLPVSGIRWYRSFPTPLTQLVVAAQNALWVGQDPISTYPYAALTQIATFSGQNANTPVMFAPVRDPAANNGSGADILIITGLTGPYGFASGSLTLSGTPTAGQTVTVTINAITTSAYTVLATDTASTIASAVVGLINQSAAVTPGSPVIGQAYAVGATINIGALQSGTAGNSITYSGTVTGNGVSISPTSATAMTGGGAQTSAPLKYDGTTISGLSYQITKAFTGCATWHNHVWLWGDPAHPDTLFATDINQPEGFTFMTQNGGYDIGVGDGDPMVRAAAPVGNLLYVFKANSIYAISGYDFQSGEYQFQVQPAIQGYGTPNSQSVTVLGNAALFWSGRAFYRLRVGSFDLEPIGSTIPISSGLASKGNQALVRAVSGNFAVQSQLNESYSGSAATATELFSEVALFAVDTGNGVADTILVYDDDASRQLGAYAWSKWSGWQVGGWIPFGKGQNATGTQPEETALLCWIAPTGSAPLIYAYGTDPMADVGAPIQFFAQTGWITMATSALQKLLHRVFLMLEATPGVTISATVTPSVTANQAGNPPVYNPYSFAFGGTGGVAGAEAHQTLIGAVNPALRANAFIVGIGENSASASFELTEMLFDCTEEPFTP